MALLLLVGLAVFAAAQGCEVDYDCDVSVGRLADLFDESLLDNSSITVCVNLSPSEESEMLGYSNSSCLPFSVVIRGNNSVVSCEDGDLGTNYTHFPLSFCGGRQVVIENLDFQRCMRPIQFTEVENVVISSSSFTDFYPGGTLDVYNTPIICICNTSFANGKSLGYGTRKYSGNAGGVAIGYSKSSTRAPNITVTGCTFRNSSANAPDGFRYSVLDVLNNRIYNQRGGGMAFFFGASYYSGSVVISDCCFEECVAQDSGGGIYMFLGGERSRQVISISNTDFTRNKAKDGGGLEITHANANSDEAPNAVMVTDCRFVGNNGTFGGGYKNIQLDDQTNLNNLTMRGSLFEDNKANVGAAIYLQAVVTVMKTTLKKRIAMEDCHFINNSAKRGVVFVIGNVVTFQGVTHFERSVGPALRILGTLVVLKGDIRFENNRHHPEGFSGALYLSSFGQIVLHENTNITFYNNTGNEGACIVVRGQLIAAAFTRQLYNPQCFLQYQDATEPPQNWKNVNITFDENKATVGPVMLIPDITICLWNDSQDPFFSTPKELLHNWRSIMTIRKNTDFSGREVALQTGIFALNLTTEVVDGYPGQKIEVEVTGLDQLGRRTSGFVEVGLDDPTNSSITFEPRIVPISPNNNTIEFQYSGSGTARDNDTVKLNPFFVSEEGNVNLMLEYNDCPAGYSTPDGGTKCACEVTDTVIFCMDDGALLLERGLWGEPACSGRELAYYYCPLGYCNCNDSENSGSCVVYVNDNINSTMICSDNRGGILCGQCMDGYGVGLLTNECQEHVGEPYYWLYPIYLITLVIILVVLVKLGIHLPTILRGFLFYIQIAPIAVAYFPENFRPSTAIASCVSSSLALYLPYDFSFHRGVTSLESYGLRFIAPVVALIVVPIAARVKHHRFKYWHSIWTIILLMYVMTLETSVSLLFCPTLNANCPNVTRVWFFDGSVKCYSNGWHIFLAILSMVSLLLQALFIVCVAAVIYYKTLRKKYAKFEQLERFEQVVTHGIKHEFKWWPIMELGCRYVFVTSVVLTPGYEVVPLILAIVIFVMQTVVHPYRDTLSNYMESLLFLWLVCLLGLGSTTELVDHEHTGWPNALLYIPLGFGFVVMAIHCMLLARKMYKERIRDKLKFNRKFKLSTHSRSFKLMKFKKPSFTETVVGLDEQEEREEEEEEGDM